MDKRNDNNLAEQLLRHLSFGAKNSMEKRKSPQFLVAHLIEVHGLAKALKINSVNNVIKLLR